jgi:hypothetical protein
MKKILIFLSFFVSTKFLIAQRGIKACRDTIAVNIGYSSLADEDHLVNDSSQRELKIVFEQDFNDKISIFLDDRCLVTDTFKTNRNLGVCLNTISIDYSKFIKMPKISVILNSKNNCVSFYPRLGKRIAYINCIEGAWSIELSNVLRDYR